MKTSSGWKWYESEGVKVLSRLEKEEQIIEEGESVTVYYYLLLSLWKTPKVNWRYEDIITDLDDVISLEFKIYNGGEEASGTFEI